MTPPIRLLLVDDDRDYLAIAQHELQAVGNVAIVGCANSGEQAVRLVPELAPDVVLMDIDMPGMNGVHATRIIKASADAPKVLAYSFIDGSATEQLLTLTGADGYVCKANLVRELEAALTILFGRAS